MTSIPKLQNENNRLNKEIKIQKDLAEKYKFKLINIEKEKGQLITTLQKKENKIKEDNNLINELKNEIENIKSNLLIEEDNKKENSELGIQKDELIEKQILNNNKINELLDKMSKLEQQLNDENKSQINLKENSLQQNENKEDIFLTRNELSQLKEKHERLKKNIEENNSKLKNIKIENENLIIEFENIEKEKEKYISKINILDENLQQLINENNLANILYETKLVNQKLIINFNNIKIKLKALSIDKNDLEEIIIKQENKVNELNNNVYKIIILLNQKNSEIDDNNLYINRLQETIEELNNEFKKLKSKKEKEKNDEIKLLRNEFMNLKMEKERNNSLSRIYKNEIDENLNYYPKIKNIKNGKLKLKQIKNANSFNTKSYINILQNTKPKVKKRIKPLKLNNIKNIYDDEETERVLNNSLNFIEKHYKNDIFYKRYQEKYNINKKNNDFPINNNIRTKSYIINDSPHELLERQEKEQITEFKSMLDNIIEQF